MNIEDELSYLFENNLKILDSKINNLILYDFNNLADYYIKIIKNEDNLNFCIDPYPEFEVYINKTVIQQMYEYLIYNQFGYKLLYKIIENKYKIYIDKNILNSLLDYYYDSLLNY
jgi:hypothetical protein